MLKKKDRSQPSYYLTGENLERYFNIQEIINQTRQRVSLGGAPDYSQRQFHEDILPFGGLEKDTEGSVTLSSSSAAEDGPGHQTFADEKLQKRREAEFMFRYRKKMDEKSDWMLDELKAQSKDGKNKLSGTTEVSQKLRTVHIPSLDINEKKLAATDLHQNGEIDMKLYDILTQEEEQRIYNLICTRYGKESGRRYLLVRSMTAPEKKIEAWTTSEWESPDAEDFSEEMVECSDNGTIHKEDITLCADMTEDVKQKMKSLVEITPHCTTETIRPQKTWKNVLRNPHKKKTRKMLRVSIKGDSMSSSDNTDDGSEEILCACGLAQCDCDLVKVKCDVPKIQKKCIDEHNEVDEVNNYLITCRENLKDKHQTDRRTTVLTHHAMRAATRETRESIYVRAAHDETESEMMNCLIKVMPPQGQECSDKGFHHVEDLANLVAERKMIGEHEWRVWRHAQAKMENAEHTDELDSFDSDIVTSPSNDDESDFSHFDQVQPSRIPYFKETFDLAHMLFEKIDAKWEKVVAKNHDEDKVRHRRPHNFLLKEKLKLLKDDAKLFNQICKQIHFAELSSKTHVPFSERKRRKRYRANKMKLELNEKQNRRRLIEGLQMGKRYRRPNRSFLYTEEENYRGFSPRRQRFLQKPGMEKFKKCDLVGRDLSGRRLTKKVIHKDYRLIRRMLDDQLKKNKESLWDPGMKERMEEYLGMLKEKKKPEEEGEELEEDTSDVSFGTTRWPKKDEQKTQTALPNSWSYCTRSSGNVADALASMIRSLRRDARSTAGLSVSNLGGPRRLDPQTPASLGRSSVWPSSLEASNRHLGKMSLCTSRLDTRQTVSSHLEPLKSLYNQNSMFSSGKSGTASTASRARLTESVTAPTKLLAKSTNALPPSQSVKASRANNLSKKYPWKTTKTVG